MATKVKLYSVTVDFDFKPEPSWRLALEEALTAIKQVKANFMSHEYATPQPLGSVTERFACGQCETAIIALKEQQ